MDRYLKVAAVDVVKVDKSVMDVVNALAQYSAVKLAAICHDGPDADPVR